MVRHPIPDLKGPVMNNGLQNQVHVRVQWLDIKIYYSIIEMEQIIRGAEQAGVKVTIVDFSNEQRYRTGLRIDKLLTSTEQNKEVGLRDAGR